MSNVFAAAGGDDDDFGAFAAAPPPVDPFTVDDPFADIVHASTSSTTASATTTATAAAASSATFGSPLLSFSPVATTASAAPFADVFAAPAEAELLSFSPLLLSTAAPSSLSSFLLDSPARASSTSSSGGAQGFSLPPPRAATAPTLSPVVVSPPKAASFSGHVSLGQLLSFSPVGSPSASTTSFADSFGSSSAVAATGASVFGDDELFSLSTVDMTLELPAATTATASEPLDVYVAAFSSPVSLSASVLGSGSETANTPAGGRSASGEAHTSVFPSPAASVSPAFLSPVASMSSTPGSASATANLSSKGYDLAADAERMSFSSSRSDSRSGSMTEDDAKSGVASDDLGASSTSVDSKWDDEDICEGAGSSFVEQQHVSVGPNLATTSAESGALGALSASGANNTVEDALGSSDDAFSAFDEIDVSGSTPSAFTQSSAASFLEPKSGDLDDFGENTPRDAADGDDFGDFGEPTTAEIGDFGDFAQSASGGGAGDDEDDGFGDFAQSSSGVVGGGADADDDFGDFVQSSGGNTADTADDDDGFSDFGQPSSFSEGDFGVASHDADFGNFTPQAAVGSFVSVNAASAFAAAESTSAVDLETFFSQAFPVESTPAPLEAAPLVPSAPTRTSFKDLFQDKQDALSNSLISTIYRSAVESYFQDAPSSADAGSVPTGIEHYTSELKAIRLKHLKFVLTEKIQEASRHDGIFPHGSEKHHVLLSLVNSDDEKKMRDALTSVQNSLFSSSVNDALMRFARQAALSAKAKIAEQAAHQQANSRGSLLATTRQLLSRSGGGGGGSATSSAATSGSGHDSSDAGGTSPGNSDDASGENTISGSESTGRRRHSGSSEADFAPRGSGSGGGGLMKKFQDRFSSFSSSRGRTRVVSLRRKGQSGEDVRTMELNMDSISGGLDQVKWKCAVFLYDVDEVAQVAPSQIRILSYPSKEVLSAKSDRAALLKFLKPGAIWTIDIGASNNNVLNAW